MQIGDLVRRVGECVLVGHSMGGLICQKVASLLPEQVKLAAFMSTAVPKGIFALVWATGWRWVLRREYFMSSFTGAAYRFRPEDYKYLMMNHLPHETR